MKKEKSSPTRIGLVSTTNAPIRGVSKLDERGTIVRIRECRDMGLTKKATALRLGMERKTVAKYWEGPVEDPEKLDTGNVKLTDYLDYITKRSRTPELTAERIYRKSTNKDMRAQKGP